MYLACVIVLQWLPAACYSYNVTLHSQVYSEDEFFPIHPAFQLGVRQFWLCHSFLMAAEIGLGVGT